MFRNTLRTRLAFAFVLSIGVFVAWGFLVFWGMMIYSSAFPQNGVYRRLVFGSDGTPVIETATYYQTTLPEYTDLDGHEFVDPSEDWQNNRFQTGSLASTDGGRNAGMSVQATRFYAFHSTTQPATFWYLRHSGAPDGGAWFEGYSAVTRRLTGYIGVHGPTASRPERAERFAVPLLAMSQLVEWSTQTGYAYDGVVIPSVILQAPPGALSHTVCVPAAENVHLVDLRNGSVRKLLPKDRPIKALQVTKNADRRSKAPQILVWTDDSVLVFNEQFAQTDEYRLPADMPSWSLSLLKASDDSTWIVLYRKADRLTRSNPTMLHWSAAGVAEPPREVPLKEVAYNQDAWLAGVSLAVPSPVTLTATVFGFAPYAMRQVDQITWSEGVARCFAAGAGPALIVLWLLSLVPAFLAIGHARREAVAQREALIWFAFVLLIGPPAYLGYRFQRRWPRQLPCPTGGHTLPADRFACPTCHQEWPLPEMKGIEVLEPAKA